MIQAKCVQVIKDNLGRTVGFKLQDSTGKTNNFYEDALIKHIKNGVIEVDNLILNESYNTLVLTNNTNWHEVKISSIYELEKLNDLIGEMQSVRDKYFL